VFIERAVEVEDVDHGQPAPQTDLVVVWVVGRRDLHAAGAHLGLGPRVGHQRDFPLQKRQPQHPPVGGHPPERDQLVQERPATLRQIG